MPAANWNDIRYLLAISRGSTLAVAARQLGVDDTTVARRLAALQTAHGTRLYQRLADGRLHLTDAGERAALRAEAIEREIGRMHAEISGADSEIAGTVRLTSVPIVVNRMLVPAARQLLTRHPALRLELVADARDYSLTRREADLALRLARPKTGGTRVKARRVGLLRYGVYVAAGCPRRDARRQPWITYDETMAHLPQARWMAAALGGHSGMLAHIRVNDAETALEAVVAGLGRSLLPRLAADCDARLRRVSVGGREPVLTREVWLLVHAELARLARITAVADWIDATMPR
jgi:DNA-binding transcriptional LysR family regulator